VALSRLLVLIAAPSCLLLSVHRMPRLALAPILALLAALLYARYRPAEPPAAAPMTAIDLEKQVGDADSSSSSQERSIRMHQVVLFGGASCSFLSSSHAALVR